MADLSDALAAIAPKIMQFAAAIAPEVVLFISELYDRYDGDADKARENIQYRREEVAAHRRARDAELARKYQGPERRGQ